MHATTRSQVVEKQADRNTAVSLIDVNVFSGRLENASTPVGNKRRSSAAPAVTIVEHHQSLVAVALAPVI